MVWIIFLSSTKARVNTVLNLATSEGWKEKIPKFSHLWAPETEIPKKKIKNKESSIVFGNLAQLIKKQFFNDWCLWELLY